MKHLRKLLAAARAAWRKARARLRSIRDKISKTRPGSERREKLRRQQDWWRDALKQRDKAKREAAKKFREARDRAPDWNGCKPVLGSLGEKVVRAAEAHGCYVTSTTGGVHAPTSYHYQGRAIDFGSSSVGNKIALQEFLFDHYPNARELFGPRNDRFIKNGVAYTIAEGDVLENQHDTHVHFAY